MDDLGQALLKLADDHDQEERQKKEIRERQLRRLSGKLEASREKLGKRLEILADELRSNLREKGLLAKLKRLFRPWRNYSDARQLALIETLLKWHQAESDETIRTLRTLASGGANESTRNSAKD